MQEKFQKNEKISRYLAEDEFFWKKHFSEFSASQSSRRVYCKNHQVNYDRFTYWIRKLSSEQPITKKPNGFYQATSAPVLMPVRVKSEESSENIKILCRLTLNNGSVLTIYDERILPIILGGSM